MLDESVREGDAVSWVKEDHGRGVGRIALRASPFAWVRFADPPVEQISEDELIAIERPAGETCEQLLAVHDEAFDAADRNCL